MPRRRLDAFSRASAAEIVGRRSKFGQHGVLTAGLNPTRTRRGHGEIRDIRFFHCGGSPKGAELVVLFVAPGEVSVEAVQWLSTSPSPEPPTFKAIALAGACVTACRLSGWK
jgi:hypothetical protein